MRIALLGNVFQTKKNAYIKRVLKKLAELQADICIEEGFADFLNRELCVSLNGMDTFKMPHLKADLVISMGGRRHFSDLGNASRRTRHSHIGHQHWASGFSGRRFTGRH